MHIVGLGFDERRRRARRGPARDPGRARGARARDGRRAWRRWASTAAFEGALKYVGNPELISRTHFARHLVEAGVCADTQAVFRKYLVEGRPGYVPHRWASLGDAVRWITQAGGVAVIAHPGRYKFSPNEEFALFSEFKAHGGQGVEVVTGSHYGADYVKYGAMALEFDLLASRGSDFHAPGESRADLGRLPGLPGQLSPVWEALASRVRQP